MAASVSLLIAHFLMHGRVKRYLCLGGVCMHEVICDVALWLCWPSDFPEYVAYVNASDPLQAVWLLMQEHDLAMVAKAAMQLPDRSIERWYGVRLEVSSTARG